LTTNELKLEKILAKDEKEFLELVASLSFGVSQKYLFDFSKAIMNELKEEIKKELREIKLINRKLFDPSLRISQAILKTKEKKKFLVVSGAPDYLLEYCENREKWKDAVENWFKESFRVYGLAKKKWRPKNLLKKEKQLGGLSF